MILGFENKPRGCKTHANRDILTIMKNSRGSQASTSVHCIGIARPGMSALAHYFLARGAYVSGTDSDESPAAAFLREKGAAVTVGPYAAKNIPRSAGLIVAPDYMNSRNPEVAAAEKRSTDFKTASETLAEIARKRRAILVWGGRGKGSAAILASLVLQKAGVDPTALLESGVREWDGATCIVGGGQYCVIEAADHGTGFLKIPSAIVLATEVPKDFSRHFKSIEAAREVLKKYLAKAASKGFLVLNRDDHDLSRIGREIIKEGGTVHWYGSKSPERPQETARLVPRAYGREALAVAILARAMDIAPEAVSETFRKYKGPGLSGEKKKVFGAPFFREFAGHPAEIRASLSKFRSAFPASRIWCVLEPHANLVSEALFPDTVASFRHADRVVVLDSVRQLGKRGKAVQAKTSFELTEAIEREGRKPAFAVSYKSQLPDFLQENVFENDVVVFLGGDGTVVDGSFL